MNNKKQIILDIIKKYNPLIFIISASLFMSLGYAAINSISIDIDGEVIAKAQEVILISDYTYIIDNKEEGESSKIVKAYSTLLHSNITLSEKDNTS